MNSGVSNDLDDLRKISSSGKEYLTELQQKEAEKTGISSLKIGFNNVFGYYLEVTNSHKNKVPAERAGGDSGRHSHWDCLCW